MMHDYHEGLPDFDARQIWHDGCAECEHRGATVPRSVGTLDQKHLRRAWFRMRDWDTGNLDGPLSKCEQPLMSHLEAVRLSAQALVRCGVDVTL